MEVVIKPEVQAKLDRIVQQSGRPYNEVLEDAINGYFDDLEYLRETLDRRYDELESGRVKPVDGEEAYRRLMARTDAQRQRRRSA